MDSLLGGGPVRIGEHQEAIFVERLLLLFLHKRQVPVYRVLRTSNLKLSPQPAQAALAQSFGSTEKGGGRYRYRGYRKGYRGRAERPSYCKDRRGRGKVQGK